MTRHISARGLAAYRALVAGEETSVPDEVRLELASLGLVTDRTTKTALVPPNEVLRSLTCEQLPTVLDQLSRITELASQIDQLHVYSAAGDAPGDRTREPAVEWLDSRSRRKNANTLVLHTAEHDLLEIVSRVPTPRPATTEPIDGLVDRGLRWRMVMTTAEAAEPDVLEYLKRWHAMGLEIRVHPDVPVWVTVADETLAVVSTGSTPSTGAVLVRARGLVRVLREWSESVWRAATPLPIAGGRAAPVNGARSPDGGPDATGRAILDLLWAGFTDEAIGRSLGISARTTRRRIAELERRHGVDNRLQLVATAAVRGWLTTRQG